MTTFDINQHVEHKSVRDSNAEHERYQDGAADAAMGESPQSTDDAYLSGYLAQLRELILTSPATLSIRWIPPSSFAYGWVDSPDPDCDCLF